MFEALAEFLPLLKAAVEWREPAVAEGYGGQGVRAYFFASFLWTHKEMKVPGGGATPRPSGLLIRIQEFRGRETVVVHAAKAWDSPHTGKAPVLLRYCLIASPTPATEVSLCVMLSPDD